MKIREVRGGAESAALNRRACNLICLFLSITLHNKNFEPVFESPEAEMNEKPMPGIGHFHVRVQ